MKKALLIGINDYPNLEKLKGAVNDVQLWNEILTQYGFEDQSITILNKPGNTYSGDILHQMRILTSGLKANDIGVIMFSGHGGQEMDNNVQTREFIYPYNDDRIIYDDEIKAIIDLKHPQAQLIFIADCCHAAGMLGRIELLVAALKDSNLSDNEINIILSQGLQNLNPLSTGLTDIDIFDISPEKFSVLIANNYAHNISKTEANDNQILLASSEKDQTSKEIKVDNQYYGAFSYYSYQFLNNTNHNSLNYESFMDAVKKQLLDNGYSQKIQLLPIISTLKNLPLFSINEAMLNEPTDENKQMLSGTISKDGKTISIEYVPSFNNQYFKEDVRLLDVEIENPSKTITAVVFRISDRKEGDDCHCPGDNKLTLKHKFANTNYKFKAGDKIRVMYLNDNKDVLMSTSIESYFKYVYKKVELANIKYSTFHYWTKRWNQSQQPNDMIKVCNCNNEDKEPRSGGNGGVIGLIQE